MLSKIHLTMLSKIHPPCRNVSVIQVGWILCNIVNFLVFYHLTKGMCQKICGN